VQGFEKQLKSATDIAAQLAAVDLHLGDARRQHPLSRRRRADEGHLDSYSKKALIKRVRIRSKVL
jgi:hypothetical protein